MSDQYGTIEAISYLQSTWIVNCCGVAAACLVFYDYVITLPREIDLIWGRSLSSVTLLFYLNRWVIVGLMICSLLSSNLGPPAYESQLLQNISSCIGVNIVGPIFTLLAFAIWAAFSAIRMYAISGGSWSLTMAVLLLSIVPVGTNAYGDFGFGLYQVEDLPSLSLWCGLFQGPSENVTTNFTISTRICAITADLLILVVTWRKTYAMRREAIRCGIETPLAAMLLRDGTIYFVLLLCLNILNIAGTATNIFNYASLFSIPLSSMIISHFLLNLRQLGHHSYDDGTLGRPSFVLSQYGDPTGSHTPSLRFATIVDNMGANLDYGFGPTFDAVDWNTTDDEANASRVNRKCDVENSVDGVHASDRSNTDAWLGGAALAGIQSQLSNFGQPHSMQSGVSATLASKNGTA